MILIVADFDLMQDPELSLFWDHNLAGNAVDQIDNSESFMLECRKLEGSNWKDQTISNFRSNILDFSSQMLPIFRFYQLPTLSN